MHFARPNPPFAIEIPTPNYIPMDDLTTSPAAANLATIIGGLLLLLLGRRLYWLFVGVIGFLAGVQFGAQLVEGQPEWMLLVVGVVTGLVAALLAVFLQRIVIALAGGLAGGILAMELATAFGATGQSVQWIAFIVGAIIAAALVSLVFDWALIVISSLLGATVVAQALGLAASLELLVILGLAAIGIVVQAFLLRRSRAGIV